LTGKLKAIRPDIPGILCTGFSEDIDEKNYKARGISEFIMKPLTLKKIAAAIRRALDKGLDQDL
jgi:CheY-like chemotaxis protein